MTTITSIPKEDKQLKSKNSGPLPPNVFTLFTYSQGLDFILLHLSSPIFPRMISTYESKGRQFIVDTKEETLIAYSNSKYLDCRINGFPLLMEGKSWIPDLLFIDIDSQPTITKKSLAKILSKTLSNITKFLGPDAKPTVLMSGNGYHIIQPVDCQFTDYKINQYFREFAQFCVNGNSAEEYLRFVEIYLSNGKADINHNPTFKSCMLRIPYTINSKNGKLVQIIRGWNGYRPQLTKELFVLFHEYLIQKKIDKELEQERIFKERRKNKKLRYNNNKSYLINYYEWIEKLLKTPIGDFRKTSLSLILAPYLVNIKKLSYQQSFDILTDWLQKCNSFKKLDFNPISLANSALNIATQKKIPPMKLETLKNRNSEIYQILQKL